MSNCQYCECELSSREQKKKDFDGTLSLICDDCENEVYNDLYGDDWPDDDGRELDTFWEEA